MATTFMEMVQQAKSEVPAIGAPEAKEAMESGSLMIDVRDAADIEATGIIPGAKNISLGTLAYKADQTLPDELRDPSLTDFDQPIVVTCRVGAMASLGGKLLQDMGYTSVQVLDGGTDGWKAAGYETE